MGSAALAIVVGTELLGDDRVTLAALGAVPLVMLVNKVLGLYDRDLYLDQQDDLGRGATALPGGDALRAPSLAC